MLNNFNFIMPIFVVDIANSNFSINYNLLIFINKNSNTIKIEYSLIYIYDTKNVDVIKKELIINNIDKNIINLLNINTSNNILLKEYIFNKFLEETKLSCKYTKIY